MRETKRGGNDERSKNVQRGYEKYKEVERMTDTENGR
jgi:hypothetical protein